jgi:hypothetical protein
MPARLCASSRQQSGDRDSCSLRSLALLDRQFPDAQPRVFSDHQGAVFQGLLCSLDGGQDRLCPLRSAPACTAQQQHAWRVGLRQGQQRPEVRVRRDQYPALLVSRLEHDVIRRTEKAHVAYMHDVKVRRGEVHSNPR